MFVSLVLLIANTELAELLVLIGLQSYELSYLH